MAERLIIDLLRHGACDDGCDEGGSIYRGRTDSPLSTLGWSQLEAAFEGLTSESQPESQSYQALYSSPLQRCRLPAQTLSERLGLPLQLDPRLQELDFGDWEGQLCQQVWQQQQLQVLAFWTDPLASPPPGGETLVELQQRLGQLLQHWLTEAADDSAPERRVLCLTHGGVIRTLVSQLLALPLSSSQQLSLDYASLSRIELYPERGSALADGTQGYHSQLVFFNRLSELSSYA